MIRSDCIGSCCGNSRLIAFSGTKSVSPLNSTKETTMLRAFSALALAAAMSFAAQAHNPKAAQGGRIIQAGHYHVELVTKGATVQVFLIGHDDKPVNTAGYKGEATLIVEGKSERVPLSPAGGNQLKGDAPSGLPENPKGSIRITSPTGGTANARFN
jgi:hypothetical protein